MELDEDGVSGLDNVIDIQAYLFIKGGGGRV